MASIKFLRWLFPLVSAMVLVVLAATPSHFRNDYVSLLDAICLVGVFLNSYWYIKKRNGVWLHVAVFCQLAYCLGTSGMDVEEEYSYSRIDCLRGLPMHPSNDVSSLEAAAFLAAAVVVAVELILLTKLLLPLVKAHYTRRNAYYHPARH